MSKDKDKDKGPHEGQHRGQDEDSLARKEYLDTLPTYQPHTPASDATALPTPVQHVENGDWGGLDE